MSKTSSAVKDRYNAKVYDEIKVRVPKGEKESIQAHVGCQGESLNGFICRAIDEAIARDKATKQGQTVDVALPMKKEGFTFADYLTQGENKRVELIDGKPVVVAPASRVHQAVSMELARQIANFLEGTEVKVFAAPFAVRLFETEADTPNTVRTVLEPDLSVVCDIRKLDRNGCKGAPELIIEILSTATARHDRLVKLALYQRAGVQEYWLVSPDEKTVQVYLLVEGQLCPEEIYDQTEVAEMHLLKGCSIDLSKVFSE